MVSTMSKADVAALRSTIAALEAGRRQVREVLPFGLNEVDGKLPGGGSRLERCMRWRVAETVLWTAPRQLCSRQGSRPERTDESYGA